MTQVHLGRHSNEPEIFNKSCESDVNIEYLAGNVYRIIDNNFNRFINITNWESPSRDPT